MSEGGGSPPSTSAATPEEVPAQAEAVLAGAAASTSLATPALVVTSLLLLILCEAARRWLRRRQRSLRSHSLPERPPDHAYYEEIDRARELLLTANRRSAIASEREERERARFRSHDPRRWRISPSYARRRTPVLCATARASSVPHRVSDGSRPRHSQALRSGREQHLRAHPVRLVGCRSQTAAARALRGHDDPAATARVQRRPGAARRAGGRVRLVLFCRRF